MTKDEIILMADASGLSFYGMGRDREKFIYYLKAFANLVAKHERKACAEVAFDGHDQRLDGDEIGATIRARGDIE